MPCVIGYRRYIVVLVVLTSECSCDEKTALLPLLDLSVQPICSSSEKSKTNNNHRLSICKSFFSILLYYRTFSVTTTHTHART